MRRIRNLFTLLAAVLTAAHSGAGVQLVRAPEVVASSNRAVIRWTTDVESGTRVQFGIAPTHLNQRSTGSVGIVHEVILEGLRPATVYHFTAGTARLRLATNSFSTEAVTSTPTVSENQPGTARQTVPPSDPQTPKTQPRPPPTRVTWGSPHSLLDHFERHGSEFQARSADDYAAQAWLFLVRAKSDGLPAKQDSNGVLRVFDPRSGAFAAYNADGTTKTYFKPSRRGYFDDQPGRAVDLRRLNDVPVPQ